MKRKKNKKNKNKNYNNNKSVYNPHTAPWWQTCFQQQY